MYKELSWPKNFKKYDILEGSGVNFYILGGCFRHFLPSKARILFWTQKSLKIAERLDIQVHSWKSRLIFWGAKDFCLNFPKIARTI